MARNFIVTGAPGAGKTTLIRALEAEDFDVVEEAATDVIALRQALGTPEPWTEPGFIAEIARLQLMRARRPAAGAVRVSDRSLFCTVALAEYLGHPVPPLLHEAIDTALAEGRFERRIFLVELLGFIVPTEARRISLAESRRFETYHVAAYRRFGFELVRVPPAPVGERLALLRDAMNAV